MITIGGLSNLCNRSLAIAILVTISLIYISYIFNACVLTQVNRSLQKRALRKFLDLTDENVGNISETRVSSFILTASFITERNRITPMIASSSSIYPTPDIMSAVKKLTHQRTVNGGGAAPSKYRFIQKQGLRLSRHLPDTLIIGVKKSGTRALLEFIRLHPDVRAAGSEVHFFDRHYRKGLRWYRHHMPYTLEGQITMEKTPSYFITKEAPRRVHQMNAQTKLLIVVRDPVNRAISDYTQAASKKIDMKSFESLAFMNGSSDMVNTAWGPIKIGIYARYLEKWLQFFPLDQLLLVSGERLITDPAYEIGRVQDFLGLKRVVTEKHFYFNATKGFPCLYKSEARSTPHCLGKTKGRNHPPIKPAAVERLRNFYRPYNNRFYQLTGIHFGWP